MAAIIAMITIVDMRMNQNPVFLISGHEDWHSLACFTLRPSFLRLRTFLTTIQNIVHHTLDETVQRVVHEMGFNLPEHVMLVYTAFRYGTEDT